MDAETGLKYAAIFAGIGVGGYVGYRVLQKFGLLRAQAQAEEPTVGGSFREGTYVSVPQPMRADPQLRLQATPVGYGLRERVAVLETYRGSLHGEGGVGIRGITSAPNRIWHDYGTVTKPSEGTYG